MEGEDIGSLETKPLQLTTVSSVCKNPEQYLKLRSFQISNPFLVVQPEPETKMNRWKMERNNSTCANSESDEPLLSKRSLRFGEGASDDETNDSDFDPDDLEEAEVELEKKTKRRKDLHKRQCAKERRLNTQITKPEVCLDCGRRFRSKTGAIVHRNVIHLNIRGPFICDVESCKQQLYTHNALEGHMNQHLGIKPYICDQCGW